MIQINEPIILANSQIIQIIGFNMSRSQVKEDLKDWTGTITYKTFDENGKCLSTKVKSIKKEEWNEFWSNFNNGTYLYNKLELGSAQNSESEFIN